jgi:4-hydroxybenzoate polyprenyltransferase
LELAIGPIVAAVLFWTAGFDILYALQDVAFDKSLRLRSLPETLGVPRALVVSRLCHVCAVGCLVWGGMWVGAGTLYFVGVGVATCLLIYEQSLVKPTDLSKINLAFFTLNGFVSLGVFVFALLDRVF